MKIKCPQYKTICSMNVNELDLVIPKGMHTSKHHVVHDKHTILCQFKNKYFLNNIFFLKPE